jgi:hypothetical protein
MAENTSGDVDPTLAGGGGGGYRVVFLGDQEGAPVMAADGTMYRTVNGEQVPMYGGGGSFVVAAGGNGVGGRGSGVVMAAGGGVGGPVGGNTGWTAMTTGYRVELRDLYDRLDNARALLVLREASTPSAAFERKARLAGFREGVELVMSSVREGLADPPASP